MGVACTNLRLSRGVLLTYLPTYLFNLSQHYDGDVDVMCNSSFAYFPACFKLDSAHTVHAASKYSLYDKLLTSAWPGVNQSW